MMILGLVRWLQPVHGYDVRRELLSWNVEAWAHIAPGSIYHALRKMTDEGLLEEVATERVGSRPERTTYRTTPAGDGEFGDLLRKYWWDYQIPLDPFSAAFAFVVALPRQEAASALRNRAGLVRARVIDLKEMLESRESCEESDREKPVHVRWVFERSVAKGEAEIAWCLRVAERIEAGEGIHEGEPGVDEAARRWRENLEGRPDA